MNLPVPNQDESTHLDASTHFHLQSLVDGVYAVISESAGAAGSNAGIIDLGERTLVFDTMMTPQAARDLRAAAVALTGRSPSWVVNSHAHDDHWSGNQVFDDCTILATQDIRQTIQQDIQESQPILANPAQYEQEIRSEIQSYEERLSKESDPRWRETLQGTIIRARHSLAALPELTLRPPDQVFEGRLTLYGKQRRVELVCSGRGHTDSDIYLHLPDEKIVFLGDLGFFQSQPFMGSCFPAEWKAQLIAMQEWNVETFVPGHGPVGTKADLALQHEYITWLEEQMNRLEPTENAASRLAQQPFPPPFDRWLYGGMRRLDVNVNFFIQQRQKIAEQAG